jgi:hypothetical protein
MQPPPPSVAAGRPPRASRSNVTPHPARPAPPTPARV